MVGKKEGRLEKNGQTAEEKILMATRSTTAHALAALRCPICLDVSTQPTTLSVCGHLFCRSCLKESLQLKRECPVCRVSATHRMMREAEAAIGHIVGDGASASGRYCLEAGSADACIPEGDGAWTCQRCTMANVEAAMRCLACNARQPARYVGHKAPPPQRHQFVMPRRPAKQRKRKSPDASPAGQEPLENARKESRKHHADNANPDAEEVDAEEADAEEADAEEADAEADGESDGAEIDREHAEEASALSTSRKKPTPRCTTTLLHYGARQQRRIDARPDDNRAGGEWPLARSIWHSKSGYKNVTFCGNPNAAKKPWQAKDDWGKSLGMYAEPKDAALAYSKWLGFEAASRLAEAVERELKPMTSEEALQAAAREGLVLRRTMKVGTSSPYVGVYLVGQGTAPRPWIAKKLGCFPTAEEAALELARSEAKKRAAAAAASGE